MKNIDFTMGIRSEPINDNFKEIIKQLSHERRHVAGYGIMRGLELSRAENFDVLVKEGVVVDKAGGSFSVDEAIVSIQPLTPDNLFSELVTVNIHGICHLTHHPYSIADNGHYTTDRYRAGLKNDLVIVLQSDFNVVAEIGAVIGRAVYIPQEWAGLIVRVTYRRAEKRIDAVTITDAGDFEVLKGIISSSPTLVNLGDYPNHYVLGLVELTPALNTDMVIYHQLRDYRSLFVGDDNRLLVCGEDYLDTIKKLKNSGIYTKPPEQPEENQFWYDPMNNKIRVWRTVNNDPQWVPIDSIDVFPVKNVKRWFPADADYPAPEPGQRGGYKHFLVNPEKELDMLYIPGVNALEIVIDNAPLMSDQYTETTITDDMGQKVGVGFSLAQPLDKPAYVEMKIQRYTINSPGNLVYQRSATFSGEDLILYNGHASRDIILSTSTPRYAALENQLEVFHNGARLVRGIGYHERSDNHPEGPPQIGEAALLQGERCRRFYLSASAVQGDTIAYRVVTNIYSYNHFGEVLDDINRMAMSAMEVADEAKLDAVTLTGAFNDELTNIKSDLQAAVNRIAALETSTLKTNSVLALNNLNSDIKARLYQQSRMIIFPANQVSRTIENVLSTDQIQVFHRHINEKTTKILVRNVDYIMVATGNNIEISLMSGHDNMNHEALVVLTQFGI